MSSTFIGHDLGAKAALLDLLLCATQDGLVDCDLLTGETTYSARFRHLLGFDETEHALSCAGPAAWRELMHDQDAPLALKLIDEHLQLGWPLFTTVRMRHRYGGYRHILMRGAAQRDEHDRPVRLLLTFSDIDERIRSDERQRALITALPDTLFRVRGDGTVLNLKRGAERSDSPFSGLHEGFKVHDGIRDARVLSTIQATLAEPYEIGGDARTLRVSTLSGGAELHHEMRLVRSSDDELVCIVRDVTEQRALESQLLQSQKLGAIGQLAAGVAHEINTPMQFIGDNLQFARTAIADLISLVGMLRRAIQQAREAPPSEAQLAELAQAELDLDFEYAREALPSTIERALTGVERVSNIVHAMKSFAHPDGDTKAPADLRALIESTVTVATNEWKYVADVELDLDGELPPVPCIAGELNQVILNLIVNASHAIADVVGQSGRKGKITITSRREATHAVIRVRDSGTGIPEHARARVFEPFFTTKEVGKGTGQGLAMAYNSIVKRHQGTIAFETELGAGTTFVIRLPLSTELCSGATS